MSEHQKKGAALSIDNLSKRYGKQYAVNSANMQIKPGEFITFLGPSGSGKTTTLSMVAGFTNPTAGDIQIDGKSTVTTPVHQRNIGMVFQNYALFPHLSIADNIAFPLKMRHLDKSEVQLRVKSALELVKLAGLGDRRPKQLSGGQQQRVALARALVYEPNLLLLDEPLGALDANLREEMKFELKELHHRIGATILFVTHDQEEALTLSDRIAVFNQGQVVQMGTPDNLYRYPNNAFVADFIGEANEITGNVIEQSHSTISLAVHGLNIKCKPRQDFAKPNKIATFTLRYESITVGEGAEACENCFEAKVQEFLYSGSTTKFLFKLNDKVSIAARVSQRDLQRTLSIGDTLKIGWHSTDILLVECDPG